MWEYQGQKRPPFAEQEQAGQESVWDYPRPPKLEAQNCVVEVFNDDILLAHSVETIRVLETASPLTVYIPEKDIEMSRFATVPGQSFCEWKGRAVYWKLLNDPDDIAIAWSYPDPFPEFDKLRGHLCFYPGRIACFIDGERVLPQPGKFYGGWVTSNIVGPFKGEPGTGHW